MDAPVSPFVSVVIAFLNEEQFLSEAVDSVLKQDYQHWELLLVDDGSTDHSTAIAKRYAEQRPGKIIYCDHEGHLNKGLSASRNRGIQAGTGSLIALLDADDVWRPGKLANQVAIFQAHQDVAMIAEASLYWYSWNDQAKEDVLIAVGAPAGIVYQPTELSALLYPLGAGAAPCPSGLMVKRHACLRAGGFEESFTKKYQLYEDQAFLSKIYLREKVYVSSACNNLYRQRHGSIVQAVKAQGQYDSVRRYFLEWLTAYLSVNELPDPWINNLVANAIFPYKHSAIDDSTAFSFKKRLTASIKTGVRKIFRLGNK